MTRHTWKVATLLFGSGLCALVYQTSWLRQFRLIFGASTLATAAVLAIFMGGLGLGSAVLGKRADASRNPLRFYANLELLIAGSAAISPLLLAIVERIYIATGGSTVLGPAFGTVVRLLLATLVLAIPTFLMGGTLPAAARAVESHDDDGRRRLALLYGLNTLGAVTGAVLSTFLLLEHFGNRQTLFVAVLLNGLVAMFARSLSRDADVPLDPPSEETPYVEPAVPAAFVYTASAAVGFSFLLMELVWYRMLSPLLGGTTFMFGLILAIALLGIGLGGAAYSFSGGVASSGAFALTCAFEALAIAVPFALGDDIALLTNYMRSLGALGFGGHLISWILVTMIVVFPAAFISGVQFPILLSLLGRGRADVGRQVGSAYAWNTLGAIAGSLAGGFGLMPLLSAPGCWRLVTTVLAGVALVALVYVIRQRKVAVAIFSGSAAIIAVLATLALGPTATWRHSGIGAGRAMSPTAPNEILDWMMTARRGVVFDGEGRESNVALVNIDDLAMIVNGKSDGAARGDAGTQVMSAMIAALLHRDPRSSLVVGLGTGTTAGWLAAIPRMQRVDAVELEPLSIDVARACASVNRDVLQNPKVSIQIGDAREVLLTTPRRYDIIFSEPSNPYRAGIASLFTREYYEATAMRLNEGGIFAQWTQAYSIDATTLQTIYATLSAVFPYVETWWTTPGDIVLLASRTPITHDMASVRTRLTTEPYRAATHNAWRVESAEGILGHFIAPSAFTKLVAAQTDLLNTDDRTPIEFGFARSLGNLEISVNDFYQVARKHGLTRPDNLIGAVDWSAVEANRATSPFADSSSPKRGFGTLVAEQHLREAAELWQRSPWEPANSEDLALLALALAETNAPAAEQAAAALRRFEPIEADAILARLRLRQQNLPESRALITRSLLAYRSNPWPLPLVMRSALLTAAEIAMKDPANRGAVVDLLSQQFAAGQLAETRRSMRVALAHEADECGPRTMAALAESEPWPIWRAVPLQIRARCYAKANLSELASRADDDLQKFLSYERVPLAP